MQSWFSALGFLTVFPIPLSWMGGKDQLSRSVFFYPLVGLILGGAIAGIDHFLHSYVSGMPSSVITVALLLLFSGCLHMDGLADSADGFFSSRPRERMLEIMRDSHVGVMGVISIVLILLLKITALASLPLNLRWQALVLAPLAGRCAILLHWRILPYARKEGGLASSFRKKHINMAFILGLPLLLGVGWYLFHIRGMITALCVLGSVLVFSIYCYRKIGGMTGDTLGATCEMSEALILVMVSCGLT